MEVVGNKTVNTKSPEKAKQKRQSREDDFMDIGVETKTSFKKKKSKGISDDKWWEDEDRGF